MGRAGFIFIIFLFLSGCTLFTPEEREPVPEGTPGQFSLYREADDRPSGLDQWWLAFENPELNRFIDEALEKNFDIRTAWAALTQAAASVRITGADRAPSLDFNTGVDQTFKRSDPASSGKGGSTDTTTGFELGAAAAYELDLWGRLSALETASRLEYMATRQDLETIAVSTAAAVTEAWINLLATQQQIDILKRQIQVNETLLELQYLRFSNGRAKALDVSQQKEQLARTKAEMPGLERQKQELKNSLGLLLGRMSSQDIKITTRELPLLIPLPDTGLPADLIAARPDVRAAGLRLHSADWTVSAARADRLPALNLTASGAFGANSLNLLFNNWVATLTAALTGPVFDGGKKAAEVERTRAVAKERLADYTGVVATAISEVENAMVREARQEEYITLLEEQLKAARISMKDAGIQYTNGQSDFLSFLVARTSVQSLELSAVQEKADQIINRIALYRAIGSDWPKALAEPESAGALKQNDQGA